MKITIKNVFKLMGLGIIIAGVQILGKESGRTDIAFICLGLLIMLTVSELITLNHFRRVINDRRPRRKTRTDRTARWKQQLHNSVTNM